MLSELFDAWNKARTAAAARRRDDYRYSFLKAKRLLTGSETVELMELANKLGRQVPPHQTGGEHG